jgi:sec-independent protein translocase protein TatB
MSSSRTGPKPPARPAQELEGSATVEPAAPVYRHPGKNWRLKRGAVPQWYKSRNGVRTKAQSGAARVARYRPQKFH